MEEWSSEGSLLGTKTLLGVLALLLGERTLLGAKGIAIRSKEGLLVFHVRSIGRMEFGTWHVCRRGTTTPIGIQPLGMTLQSSQMNRDGL